MKKVLALITLVCVAFCFTACGEEPVFDLDGKYVTETAYGMVDFISEIEIAGSNMELTIEHYGEVVEENSGHITKSGKKIKLIGSNGDLEFVYNEKEKTLHNEMMETTWTFQEPEIDDDAPVGEPSEPDPIPEEYLGEYKYSDNMMEATITVTENEYSVLAVAKNGTEPLEVSGAAVFAGNQLLFLEDGQSISCPVDAENGTLEYEGYTFKK